MKKTISVFRSCAVELLLVFFLLFTFNNYTGYATTPIHADGAGYYEYLPALFIYHDFPRAGEPCSGRVQHSDSYVIYEGKKLDKYPCGTALLLLPFFTAAHFSAGALDYRPDGFSFPYQRAVFMGALTYLFLGLVFVRKLLKGFGVGGGCIFLVQLLMVFATPLIYYANDEASFSHVYSFFAVGGFAYHVRYWFLERVNKKLLWAGFFFALVFLLRPVNVLVLFAVPFLSGSLTVFRNELAKALKDPFLVLKMSGVFWAIAGMQFLLWHRATGQFFIFSYVGERFNFGSPALIDTWFSYRKGLFVYTPVLLFAVLATFHFIPAGKTFLLVSWWMFFLVASYVISSWWCWWYGASYGQRPFIDLYPVLFVPVGMLLQKMKWGSLLTAALLLFLTVPLNVIQVMQYKNYIFHWSLMDREKYWTVFLRDEKRFCGLFWKRYYSLDEEHMKDRTTITLKDEGLPSQSSVSLFSATSSQITHFNSCNMIRLRLDNDFDIEQDAEVALTIADSSKGTTSYSLRLDLLKLNESGLNRFHRGDFNFEVPELSAPQKIRLELVSHHKEVVIKNPCISFFHYTGGG